MALASACAEIIIGGQLASKKTVLVEALTKITNDLIKVNAIETNKFTLIHKSLATTTNLLKSGHKCMMAV